MANVTEREIPYEVLVRIVPSDTEPFWTLSGAHIQTRKLLLVDGVLRADEIQPARPLSDEDAALVTALIAHFQSAAA